MIYDKKEIGTGRMRGRSDFFNIFYNFRLIFFPFLTAS
jgi:hypothetical protein